MNVPQASISLTRYYDYLTRDIKNIKEMPLDGQNKGLYSYVLTLLNKFEKYIRHLIIDIKKYWANILNAMKRQAGDSWDLIWEKHQYEIFNHLNKKICQKIRTKAQKKGFQKLIDNIRIAKFYYISIVCEPKFTGIGYYKRALYRFSRFSSFANLELPDYDFQFKNTYTDQLLKMSEVFSQYKEWPSIMLQKHIKRILIHRYYKNYLPGITFINKPKIRSNSLVYEVIKKILHTSLFLSIENVD